METFEMLRQQLEKPGWILRDTRIDEDLFHSLLIRKEPDHYLLVTHIHEGHNLSEKVELKLDKQGFSTFEDLQTHIQNTYGGLAAFLFYEADASYAFNSLFNAYKNDSEEKFYGHSMTFLEQADFLDMWARSLSNKQKNNDWLDCYRLITCIRAYGGYQKGETERKIVQKLCDVFVEAVRRAALEPEISSWHASTTYHIMDFFHLTPSTALHYTPSFYQAMEKVFRWNPPDYTCSAFMTMYRGSVVVEYEPNPHSAKLLDILASHPDDYLSRAILED